MIEVIYLTTARAVDAAPARRAYARSGPARTTLVDEGAARVERRLPDCGTEPLSTDPIRARAPADVSPEMTPTWRVPTKRTLLPPPRYDPPEATPLARLARRFF